MSRLFEALSGLKTEHRAAEVVAPVTIASPAVVPPTPKQEAKPEQHSLIVVPATLGPLSVALPERVHEVEGVNQTMRKPAEHSGASWCPGERFARVSLGRLDGSK